MARASKPFDLSKSLSAYRLAAIAIVTSTLGAILIINSSALSTILTISILVATVLLLIRYIHQIQRAQADAEMLRKTLEAVVDIQWHWDLRSGVIGYKGRLLKILDYPDGSDADPDFWRELVHPIDRPLQKYQLLRHLEDESVPYYSEYRMKNKAGDYEWFAARGKFVSRDERQIPTFMVGSIEHIQHRKDLEQSLIHAHKMEALGQLTGGIAHDFNNILASILGYTELAMESPTSDRIPYYLEQIHLGGKRARNVIRQLLDFSRTPKSDTQVLNLKQETNEAVKMLRATLPTTIIIQEDYPEEDCFTRLDPNELQRALLNLCINARDAMSGKGHLYIRLKTEDLSNAKCSSCQERFQGKYHVIQVTDEGEGIHDDIQLKLFEPFFTTKEFGKGTGMGLSVVHGIVHDYNGHIDLRSLAGSGTTVLLYFPFLHREPEQLTIVSTG